MGGEIHPGKGKALVMAQLVLTLLADLVFRSVDSTQRHFSHEMNRYFEKRGLAAKPAPRPVPAR
jgi:hypothetical protein